MKTGKAETEPSSKDHQAIPLDTKIFDRYAGHYRLSPAVSLAVFRREDVYLVQLSGQSAVRIYPESETEFFMTVVNARLSFDLDSKGLVTGLTLIQNGRRRQGKKYDPPILTTEEAEAYVGKYYSGELETYYLISREEGRLFIKIGTNPKSELRFVKKDEFQNPLRMSFSRNHSDAVTGFHIFAGRVRNIVFIRE